MANRGAVVVGRGASAAGNEAFYWTPATGIRGLGDIPGGVFNSIAEGVSEDGSVVVGWGQPASGVEAFRWTAATGLEGLGDLPGGLFSSEASGVSRDGAVIVGRGRSCFCSPTQASDEAFAWTEAAGMEGLGDVAFPFSQQGSAALGVSPDGSVAVGWSFSRPGGGGSRVAVYWPLPEDAKRIGDLPGGPSLGDAFASASSRNGAVIVGRGRSDAGFEAFRWTEAGGMEGLGDLGAPPGSFFSEASDVSGSGRVIVGIAGAPSGNRAFIWDPISGMRDLKTVLESEGLNLFGWTLTWAYGVSEDGRAFAGVGRNPAGQDEAWVAYLPEPKGGLAAVLLAFIALTYLRSMSSP